MINSYVVNIPKSITMAASIDDDYRIDELMDFLESNHLLDQYAHAEGLDLSQVQCIVGNSQSGFYCDVNNGIFVAPTSDQHESMMRHLKRLQKYGQLSKVPKSNAVADMAGAQMIVPVVKTNPPPAANTLTHAQIASAPAAIPSSILVPQITRDQILDEFVRTTRARYDNGIPIRLTEALTRYCKLKGRDPSRDERSRIKILDDELGGLCLHEYTIDHFLNYAKRYLEGDSTLNVRTIDERIALARRVYEFLIDKRVYFGLNPLKDWKQNETSQNRKKSARASIPSIDRVLNLFGTEEFAAFGTFHPAYYLIIMTAIVTGMRISSICRLTRADLLITIDDIPVIDVKYDKTDAGVRQVPVPLELFDALCTFLETNQTFGIADRGHDKGCSDAIRKLNQAFICSWPQFKDKLINPHKLRAALNNYMAKNGVAQDVRCAFLGHAQPHVNSKVYADAFEPPVIVEGMNGIQDKILDKLHFDPAIASMNGYIIAGKNGRFDDPYILQ